MLVLRRPDKAGAAARIWNLVVTTPLERLNANQIAESLTATRTRGEDVRPVLRQLYSAALYEACRDDDLTDAEVADLRLLRRALSITDAEVLSDTVNGINYDRQTRLLISDGDVTAAMRLAAKATIPIIWACAGDFVADAERRPRERWMAPAPLRPLANVGLPRRR